MSESSLLVVRADAHAAIGSGHVMRCLAIAQAWLGRGGSVAFVGVIDEATRRRLADEGCRTVVVESVHPDPSDLATTRAVLASAPGAALLVDGYGFDPGYLEAAGEAATATAVLDDMAALPRYPCDVVVNPNFAREDEYAGRGAGLVLCGPRLALLRRELREGAARTQQRPRREPRNVLFTFGGSDPANLSPVAFTAARRLADRGLSFRCLLGLSHPRIEQIRDEGVASGVEVLVAVRDMTSQLGWADLAVAAAGSTSWELALFGVPSLAVVVADNQRRIAEGMASHGAARHLGEAGQLEPAGLAAAIRDAVDEPAGLWAMGDRARTVVDGKGALRVVDALRAISRPE